MKIQPSSPFIAAMLLTVLAAGTGACTNMGSNSSTPPKFNDAVPDRAQGRNQRGTPQETGQSQDVTNNRR